MIHYLVNEIHRVHCALSFQSDISGTHLTQLVEELVRFVVRGGPQRLLRKILVLLHRRLKRVMAILKVYRVPMIGIQRNVLALTHQSPSAQASIGVQGVHGLNWDLLIDILALTVPR